MGLILLVIITEYLRPKARRMRYREILRAQDEINRAYADGIKVLMGK